MVVVTSLVLGATVFRGEVASAAQQALAVFVTNDAANPVPVREQPLSANAQFTVAGRTISEPELFGQTIRASLVIVDMDMTTCASVSFLNGTQVVLRLFGPGLGGPGHQTLALTQPITMDRWMTSLPGECGVNIFVSGTALP